MAAGYPNITPASVTYAGAPVDPNAQRRSKKSRVIPPDRRKKVAQACDPCKRRKQKCNGLKPCDLCSSRATECLYTAIDRRLLKPSKKLAEHTPAEDSSSTATTESINAPSGHSPSVQSLLHHPVDTTTTARSGSSSSSSTSSKRTSSYTDSLLQKDQLSKSQKTSFSDIYFGANGTGSPPSQYSVQSQWQDTHQAAHLPHITRPLHKQSQQYPHQLPDLPLPHYPLPPQLQYNQLTSDQKQHDQQSSTPSQLELLAPPNEQTYSYTASANTGSQHIEARSPFEASNVNQGHSSTTTHHPIPTKTRKRPSVGLTYNNTNKCQKSPFPFSHPRVQIPASLQPLLSFPLDVPAGEVLDESYNNYVASTGNDQNWRLLFDDAGNLRYVGDSSGTAYLLQCRKLFEKVLGSQKFSDDPDRFTYVDIPAIILKTRGFDKLPRKEYTDYLVSTYLNNLNHVLYILEQGALIQLVDQLYSKNDASTSSHQDICILYLVLAIGSVYAKAEISKNLFPFPLSDFTDPLVFFETSMTALNSAEDDNIWMSEAYLLIFFFYQFTGHKNTAWIKLGCAIRYAQGLGLNRKYVNESYKDQDVSLHRRKLFRSLFIMDTLSAVHLGRPMTLRLDDWDDIKFFDNVDDYVNKVLKVCVLNSRILEHVYYNTNFTLKKALKIAVELKIHGLRNPIKPASLDKYPILVDHKTLLPHVIYLHGIILLSRPFFQFIVFKKLGLVTCNPASKNLPHLSNFYHSCIKASLLIIKTVEYCYYQNIHPFKPVGLISCTFHAGLVLGLLLLLRLKGIDHEMFKNDPQITDDPDAILSHAMASVIKVLVHYGRIDQESRKYADILQSMLDVTEHLPAGLDGNESDSSSHTAEERKNTQEDFENILRFQDWLFPRPEDVPMSMEEESPFIPGSGPSSSTCTDNLLKDITGLSFNADTISSQFLDDFLYAVMDSGNPGGSA